MAQSSFVVGVVKALKSVYTKGVADILLREISSAEQKAMTQKHALELVQAIAVKLKSYAAGASLKPQVEVFNPEFSKHSGLLVLAPDMPFIVDTVLAALRQKELSVHYAFHPVVDTDGKKINVADKKSPQPLSLVWIEFDRCNDVQKQQALAVDIQSALKQLTAVTQDFPKMVSKLQDVQGELEDHAADQAFLSWLEVNNFVFLGYRHYDYTQNKAGLSVKVTPKSGLGILRDDKKSSVAAAKKVSATGTTLQHYVDSKSPITISKTPDKTTLHRHVHMDYVGVKQTNAKGNIIGEHRFLGLYTSQAYATNIRDIPLIKDKMALVLKRYARKTTNSANQRALANVLEMLPRDELFLMHPDDLYSLALGVLQLQDRQQVWTYIRKSAPEGAVTAFIYLPMNRMNSKVRRKIEAILMAAYGGESAEFKVSMEESSTHARIIYKIKTQNPCAKHNDEKTKQEIMAAAKGWSDGLRHELISTCGEYDGLNLFNAYEQALPLAYQEVTPPHIAVDDIQTLAIMDELQDDFVVRVHQNENALNVRLFRRKEPVELSTVMPLFANLGLYVATQNSFSLTVSEGADALWVHDFHVPLKAEQCVDAERLTHLVRAITAVWQQDVENDTLNSLVLTAGLSVEDIFLARALAAYAQQVNVKYSKALVHSVLNRHAAITRALVSLFKARFDLNLSASEQEKQQQKQEKIIVTALQNVAALDDDNIIRLLMQVIYAGVRSNYSSKHPTAPLAIKLQSEKITSLPKPLPWREIFVYHRTLEGVHLRGGAVARGGLRHSDRHSDFRTEVLGLMKAQMTKNTIIVPVGAKGGFVIKEAIKADSRAAYTAAVETYYSSFIKALLSVADNVVKGKVLHPLQTVIYDGEDPYFVVAADKGTATFSDTANNIAITARNWQPDVGYWLGDAFASGGSQGYDHKKMGITARGAWESVKHHGRQLGMNTQEEDFTVVGIGDMGGDVFGNGMLLSQHIRLIGAFNHLHIFVDPEPDAATTYKERERLFKLGKGWDAYNQKLLSKGGAIFERSAKSLKISPQIQKRLGLTKGSVTPNELMKALLSAKVDLLWNGGIGTYIKAKHESDAEVSDRANDDIRLNGEDLRCKMIGEGGNLGATQAGRIEYALSGGLINTDALDNSAGVDSSDHEVNIKILLKQAVEKGDLTERQRNTLLVKMTNTVAEHVLRNNYLQNQAITIKAQSGVRANEVNYALQEHLVRTGQLDIAVEGLPDAEVLASRAQQHKQGYTRPELSVLMAYAKAEISAAIMSSTLPKSAALQPYLKTYFPQELHKKYATLMPKHRLWQEIIATVLTNDVVNRMGMTFVNRMQNETGANAVDVLAAYLISKHLYGADALWRTVENLDHAVPADMQFKLFAEIKKLVEYGTFWVLRNFSSLNFGSMVEKYADAFGKIESSLTKTLPLEQKRAMSRKAQEWTAHGVPADVADKFVSLELLDIAPDVAYISLNHKQDVRVVLEAHLKMGNALHLPMLHDVTSALPQEDGWQRAASLSINDSLHGYHRALTLHALKLPPAADSNRVDAFLQRHQSNVDLYNRQTSALKNMSHPTHAVLQALLGQLKGLCG